VLIIRATLKVHVYPTVCSIRVFSDNVCRYLVEECLELQLWLSESVKDSDSRPNSRDILVGTASIPLLPLACVEDQPVTIK